MKLIEVHVSYSFSSSFVLSSFLRMAAWDLSVIVEELGLDAPPVKISVTSDLHIGGVILKIVEKTRELNPVLYILYMNERIQWFYSTVKVLKRLHFRAKIFRHHAIISHIRLTHILNMTRSSIDGENVF